MQFKFTNFMPNFSFMIKKRKKEAEEFIKDDKIKCKYKQSGHIAQFTW